MKAEQQQRLDSVDVRGYDQFWKGWPWKPADEVRAPELAYWLQRAEATFSRRPAVSWDFVQAIRSEIAVVEQYRYYRSKRLVAGLLGVMFSVAIVFAFNGPWMLNAPIDTPAGMAIVASTVIILAWLASQQVAVWFDRRAAHRIVVARDRLHRWLDAVAAPAALLEVAEIDPRHLP